MSLARIAAALIGIGCAIAGSGCPGPLDDLAAKDTGDVSRPATRGSPDADLLAACGRGWTTEAGRRAIGRLPYVQRVGAHSAAVVWTTSSTDPQEVLVWKATGRDTFLASSEETVSTLPPAEARQDVSSHPEGGLRQMVAELDGLEPSASYCYALVGRRAGSTATLPPFESIEDGELLIEPIGMRTAPAPEARAPVRFVAWGDSGDGGPRQIALLGQMRTVPFDLMLVLGDVAYERGKRSELEDNFFGVYYGLVRSFPVHPVAGNHDYDTEDAAPLLEAFLLPENGGEEGRERWYSFDWGDVHFVGLDTERIGPAQAQWLDADLAATDRGWTIVFAHRPPWSSGEHGGSLPFKYLFAPILERHGVALMLAGHDHDYERLVRRGATQYVVSGGGGRETRPILPNPELTAHGQAVIHFVYVTVDRERLTLHAIDGTGREFDSLQIDR